MTHQTDTPSSISVPRHTRLLRRNGTYYLRAKVPKKIRHLIGKTEIRKSLGTKDPKEAVRKVKIESTLVDQRFAAEEAKLNGSVPPVSSLSDEEINCLVSKYFIRLEQEARRMIEHEVDSIADAFERQEAAAAIADNWITDNLVLHQKDGYQCYDSHWIVDNFLAEEGKHLNVPKGSVTYNSLFARLKQAVSETQIRTIDRLQGRQLQRILFKNLDADSVVSHLPRKAKLLGEFLDEFMDYQRQRHTETTPSSYKLPVRVLREIIGDDTPLPQITRHHLEKTCEILHRVPVNMTQRYPGSSLPEAIAAAQRQGVKKLQPRTLSNYYTLIVAIFNYARDEGFINENPAKSRKLREMFQQNKAPTRRCLFKPSELNAIFHARLYSSCKDDEKNSTADVPPLSRQGRFWVPLLALFQGLRCNEACQLYTEDVTEENGIPCIKVREDLDNEQKSDKRVKNRASWRTVPIHPKILEMGFLAFAKERQVDERSPRLFPDLSPAKNTGRYSHVFSKWFGRFLIAACGYKPKATFHSFRHHFRTSLMDAGVPTEQAEALGGWKPESSSEYEYRHGQLPTLRAAIEKVVYPDLDLTHLTSRRRY